MALARTIAIGGCELSTRVGWLALFCALAVLGCQRIPQDIAGFACDPSGACESGYECHETRSVCGVVVTKGCDGVGACWRTANTGDKCIFEGGLLPCLGGGDCEAGCRQCDDGVWSACETLDCDIFTVSNCAACGDDCSSTVQNATPACLPGADAYACGYLGSCDSGFVDLDGIPENGCECENEAGGEVCDGRDNDCDGDVDELEGAAGDVTVLGCGPEELCQGGACRCGSESGDAAPACGPGSACELGACICPEGPDERYCDHECVDTSLDAGHCGGCEVDCNQHPGVDSATLSLCIDGACSYACAQSLADCDPALDGCERDIQQTAQHCGACDNDCSTLPHVDMATCEGGACVLECETGFKDCDQDPSNGCEPEGQGIHEVCPALSCNAILSVDAAAADGVYWLSPDTGAAFQAVCDMTSDGGGWTLLLKATRGTVFTYDATYWTVANTLNQGDLTLGDANAKYDSFNRNQVHSLRAVWPDFDDDGDPHIWLEVDVWPTGFTALEGFDRYKGMGRAKASSTFDSNYFSSQGNMDCGAGKEMGRYGINLTPSDLCSHCANPGNCMTVSSSCRDGAQGFVRWGYRFNENGCCNWASDDTGGGIGLLACRGYRYSAGDWYSCCGSVGKDRSARVEIWGR